MFHALVGILFSLQLSAQSLENGMWRPDQLSQLDPAALENLGLRLSPDAIYHPEKPALKDAIVSFGGFCTAAFISEEGLLLTNHHCAYGAISARTTRGRDLLQDGFWAADRSAELPNPGLSVSLLLRSEEVSAQVLQEMPAGLAGAARQAWLDRRVAALEKQFAAEAGLEAVIKPGPGGKSWHLQLSRRYTDIRLVGAPPVSIARFGGDAAGRDWPMHTADFALFRVYAGPDNAPAKYHRNNVPFRPAHHLPLALTGVAPGDFTMVAGYPGHTQQYLSSFALRERLELYNPTMVRLRTAALQVLEPNMQNSKHLRRKYESMYSSLHNTQASLQGEMAGMRKLDAVGRKMAQEVALQAWVAERNDRKEHFGTLLHALRMLYLKREMHLVTGLHLEAALSWVGLIDYANSWRSIGDLPAGSIGERQWSRAVGHLQQKARQHFRKYSAVTDQQMCARMMALLHDQLPASHRKMVFPDLKKRFSGDFERYAAHVFAKSALVSPERVRDLLQHLRPDKLRRLQRDPGYALMSRLVNYYNAHYHHDWVAGEMDLADLQRQYEAAVLEMAGEQLSAADADGTLRFSLGQVADYAGVDGIRYRYCTTTRGMLEKYAPRSEAYDLPERFVGLLKAENFGRYGAEGGLAVNFMATNHTANGNSGSPVLDGVGRIVGLNSARTLESAMSDVIYDRKEVRNVAVDIRYILFVMDKFAGARHLLQELDVQD